MVSKTWNMTELFVRRAGQTAAAKPHESSTSRSSGPAEFEERPQCNLWGSVRLTYTICAFISMVLHVSMRNMLGLIILRMVKPRPEDALLLPPTPSNTTMQCDKGSVFDSVLDIERSGDLEWTRSQELTFAGTFYYGYAIALPLAGRLADRLGGKLLFIMSLVLQALANLGLPYMAHQSYGAAVSCLVLCGLFAGCGTPSLYQLFVIWAHPTERTALLSFAYSGLVIGTMIIYPVASFLSDFGWEMPFYVIGTLALLYGISCQWLVYNSLEQHPRLTATEKEYLMASPHLQPQKHVNIPWRALLTSLPVYAFIFTHIFHNYGYIVLALVMPRILRESMHFTLREIGLLSSAPYLGSLLSKILCVVCCSYVEKGARNNLTCLRRILYIVCTIIAMSCIGTIIYASCEQKLLVVMMYVLLGTSTDLGFSGGYWPTLLYFAPSFAGLLSGVANGLAHLCGFLAPYGIAALVETGTKTEWNNVLITLIAFYTMAMIVFGSCSSSELQSWDTRSDHSNAAKSDIKVTA